MHCLMDSSHRSCPNNSNDAFLAAAAAADADNDATFRVFLTFSLLRSHLRGQALLRNAGDRYSHEKKLRTVQKKPLRWKTHVDVATWSPSPEGWPPIEIIRVANLCLFIYEDHHTDRSQSYEGIHSGLNVQDWHVLKRLIKNLNAWVNFTFEKTNESKFRSKSHDLCTEKMNKTVTERKQILRAFFKRKRFIKFFRFWQFFLMKTITVGPSEKTDAGMKWSLRMQLNQILSILEMYIDDRLFIASEAA